MSASTPTAARDRGPRPDDRGHAYDYVTVGHVTVDELHDERDAAGARRPGGGAFYSALQAARLGLRTLIVTQGVPRELQQLLEPYRGELDVEIVPAAQSTTFATSGLGAARRQRVLAWAGPITRLPRLDTAILHLAPVARETPTSWAGSVDFVGVTPQGLVRRWSEPGGEIEPVDALDPERLPAHWDALVISQAELASCRELIAESSSPESSSRQAATDAPERTAGSSRTQTIVVTAGSEPATIHLAGGRIVHAAPRAIDALRDDLGAGDVFAAAFFVALREGLEAAAAADFASAAAAVRIAGVGPDAVGTHETIAARLREAPAEPSL